MPIILKQQFTTGIDQSPFAGYNYYRVRSIDVNGKAAYTQVVKVLYGSAISQEISIFPNPVVNGVVNLQLTNQAEGIYNVRVLNSLGQPVLSKQIRNSEGNVSEKIQLNKNIGKGIYQVEITKPGGDIKMIQIIY